MSKIAIVIVTYNRLESLKRLVKSLSKANYLNDQVDLIISIDRSKVFEDIYRFSKKIQWEHGDVIIKTYPARLGLRKHILSCGNLLNDFEHLIVLEDDLYVSPNFYHYSVSMIEKYAHNIDVAGISLYSYPRNQYANLPFYPLVDQYDIYFMKIASSWGQVWSRTSWQLFIEWLDKNKDINNIDIPDHIKKWDEKSWLKYHHAYCADTNKYFIYPRVSLSTNFSEIGEHANLDSTFQVEILQGNKSEYVVPDRIEDGVRYDSYFENESLNSYLPTNKDCTIDLYAIKPSSNRYLLSTKVLNYMVIEEYALRMRPWEANVINDINGKGIFLYDTYITNKNEMKLVKAEVDKYKYLFKINSAREVTYIFFSFTKTKLLKKLLR